MHLIKKKNILNVDTIQRVETYLIFCLSMSDIWQFSFNWLPVITDYLLQIIGVIDVNRTKEKGYPTVVKEGFCDEVKPWLLILFFPLAYAFFKLENHLLFKLSVKYLCSCSIDELVRSCLSLIYCISFLPSQGKIWFYCG